MTRRRAFCTATVMCMVLAAGSLAQAAEGVLGVIPEESLGFVLLNRLAATDAKVQALGRQMQLPLPSPLSAFKAKAGLAGVLDEKGTAAVALLPGKDAGSRPAAVAFLPVTNYKKFLAKLEADDAAAEIVEAKIANQSFVIGNRGGYAVVAKSGNRHALEKALGSSKRVAADMASLRGMLGDGDVAAVVTRHGVEILSVMGQKGLQQAKRALDALPEDKKQGMEAAIGVFNVYEQMIKCLGEEINSYAVAGRIDDEGNLHLIEHVRLTPGGEAVKMLGQVEPPQGDLLAGLPQGPFVFVLAGVLPESLGEGLMKFSAAIMKAAPGLYGMDEEQVDELIEISRRSMKGIRGMSMMMGVGKPGDPIYSNFSVVEKVDDSKAFMGDYGTTIEAMNRLVKDAGSSVLTTVKLQEMKIGGTAAWKLTMKIPIALGAENIPNFDELMETLFGPGGKMTAYMAAADEHTIVAAYTSRRLLRASLSVVQGSKPGLAADPQLAKTAAMLPSGALWVGYFSPKGTIDFVKRMIPAVTPEGKDAPKLPQDAFRRMVTKLPDFPETPPIGFAVKTAPDGIRSHTVVPAAVLKGVGSFVAEIKKTTRAKAAQ